VAVTIYLGNAGDRNSRAAPGAIALGEAIADRYGADIERVGQRVSRVDGGWALQLAVALPNLRRLAAHVAERLDSGGAPVLTLGRCAASLATLPVIASRYPDAAIVWFDAHGDSNAPAADGSTDAGYLGGMVLTGAAGEWRTGLGGGLDLGNVILVGSRDLDPPEQARVDQGQIALVPPGPLLGPRLERAVGGRRVYVHLDCDVMTAGLLATEYQVADGLDWSDLEEAFRVLAASMPIGLEVAEYEAAWPDGEPNDPTRLLAAIAPVLTSLLANR